MYEYSTKLNTNVVSLKCGLQNDTLNSQMPKNINRIIKNSNLPDLNFKEYL